MRGPVLLALLALGLPTPARAAEPSEAQLVAARRQFAQARAFIDQKQWIEALEILRPIAAVKDTGGVRFYMAQCEEHLAQLRAAESDYLAAIRLAPAMGVDEATTIARQSEEALVRLRPRIPQLTLRLTPVVSSASVRVDGRLLSPDEVTQPIAHDPGEARVKASAPGRVSVERTVTLAEGSHLTVELPLALLTSAPPPAPAPSPPPAPPPPPPPARWPAYVTGAVSLGALGTGIGFLVRHQRLDHATDERCADPNWRCDREGRDDKLAFYRNVTIASAGVAVAAGVVTVVLWRRSSSTTDAQVAVGPSDVRLRLAW